MSSEREVMAALLDGRAIECDESVVDRLESLGLIRTKTKITVRYGLLTIEHVGVITDSGRAALSEKEGRD